MVKTARYTIIRDTEGNRYRFFCELSGMAVHTTEPYHESSSEKELEKAWETEGRLYFNKCLKCGRLVCDLMYNADELECVACTPWENKPNYCPICGNRVSVEDIFCSKCGSRLQYRRDDRHDG